MFCFHRHGGGFPGHKIGSRKAQERQEVEKKKGFLAVSCRRRRRRRPIPSRPPALLTRAYMSVASPKNRRDHQFGCQVHGGFIRWESERETRRSACVPSLLPTATRFRCPPTLRSHTRTTRTHTYTRRHTRARTAFSTTRPRLVSPRRRVCWALRRPSDIALLAAAAWVRARERKRRFCLLACFLAWPRGARASYCRHCAASMR